MLDRLIIWMFQCLGQLCLAITQTAKAHGYRKYLIYHCQCFALTGIKNTCQYRNQGKYTGAEVFVSDLIGQWRVNKFSAVFASINLSEILSYCRDYWRYINNLMTHRLLVAFFKICAATRAYFRLKFNAVGYFLRPKQLPQMRLVAFFRTTFFTPMFRLCNGNSRWIGRRWLGRILRIHSQKPFKLFDTLFQLRVFLFQLLYIFVFVHRVFIGQKQNFTSIIQIW